MLNAVKWFFRIGWDCVFEYVGVANRLSSEPGYEIWQHRVTKEIRKVYY